MILVTVGTHEQQFNRLIREIDQLKKENIIKEDVFIQTGYSDYVPTYCEWEKLIDYEKMKVKMKIARLVVTHGGPSSFMEVLAMGKIPVVVPRQRCYGEHINDHQVDFCRSVLAKGYNIILVEEIAHLKLVLQKNTQSLPPKSNNKIFNTKLMEVLTDQLEVT